MSGQSYEVSLLWYAKSGFWKKVKLPLYIEASDDNLQQWLLTGPEYTPLDST
jgi:hypothetical protein